MNFCSESPATRQCLFPGKWKNLTFFFFGGGGWTHTHMFWKARQQETVGVEKVCANEEKHIEPINSTHPRPDTFSSEPWAVGASGHRNTMYSGGATLKSYCEGWSKWWRKQMLQSGSHKLTWWFSRPVRFALPCSVLGSGVGVGGGGENFQARGAPTAYQEDILQGTGEAWKK